MNRFTTACLMGMGVALAGAVWLHAQERPATFTALFVDRQAITTRVTCVNYRPDYLNEMTVQANMLYGFRGSAEITIPWSNIRQVNFFDGNRQFNTAVLMRDNRYVLMRTEGAGTVYKGTNDFGGLFNIRAEYVRAIIFE
jgi:hypothetical protein